MRIALNAERKHGRAWQPRLFTGLEEFQAVEQARAHLAQAAARRDYNKAA